MNLLPNDFALAGLPAMSEDVITSVRKFEAINLAREQVVIETQHLIHAGMYHRTIKIPAGVELTGALIKIATTLVVCGDAVVVTQFGPERITGYHVLPASANRKQAFRAIEDTWLTMSFPTAAKKVRDAEDEFTDEADLLFSRYNPNKILVTGE